MAVTISRTAWTDDDGTGTTGTVINNAVKTELYDQIDAALVSVDNPANLSSSVPVNKGGTGVATLAAHGVVVGEGTSNVAVVGPDAATGKPLLSQGAAADPAFGDLGVAHGGTGATTLAAHGVVIGNGTSAVTVTGAGSAGQVLTSNGASADPTYQTPPAIHNAICDVRLTLTSGTPVTTADVTGATNIFVTPYKGNRIALYDGSATWNILTFTEITQALGTLTSGLPYDVFAFNNSGVVATEILAWTSASARATALVLQDGVLVKSGATTRRYLGTFYTTSTTATEDSAAKRFVWNYYNRVKRSLRVTEATDTWTYTTATFRQANNAAANQVDLVVGVAESLLSLQVRVRCSNSGAGVAANAVAAIGEDSTTTAVSGCLMDSVNIGHVANFALNTGAAIDRYPAIGRHFYAWLEQSTASNTTTWYGDGGTPATIQSGMTGSIEG
jgi:hypothetical protein